MEKYEDGIQNTLCMACLCVGRSLQALRDDKLIKFYLDTLNEIPLCNTPTVAPLVCWECIALLRKVLSFREQVKDSYRILQTYTHENLYECLLSDVSRAPRLKVHVNTPVVIAAHGDGVAVKEEVKLEWSDVSECQNDRVDDIGARTKDGAIRSEKEEREKRTAVGTKRDGGKQDRSKIRRKQSKNSSLNGDLTKRLPKMSSSVHPQTELRDDVALCEFKFETGYCKSEQDNLELSDADQNNGLASDVSDKEEETSNLREVKVKQAKKTVRSKIRKAESIVKKLKGVKKVRKRKLTTNQKILTLELSYEEMLAEREKDAERDSYTKAKYKCDTCLIGFNHSKSHNAHFAAKHSPEIGDYICPICKTIISSVESFTAHYKRHMRRYECQLCRKRTADVKAMQQHYYSTHEISLKQYKCNLCGQLSSSIDTHRYHKDTHKARVQCGECDKTFSHRAGLMNHRLAVHQFHNEFPCTVCDKVFRWKTSLKRHLEKHDVKGAVSQPGGAYCCACDVGFSSVCSLQRHLRNSLRHVTPDQLRFICDHCGRRFADKTKLRDHIEEKHLHRTYTCHICQKTSKNRVGLEQHVRNVHKGRPNNKICHHCGKGFPTKVQLESHIRTHTGERPFICEYCPTTFSQQSNLYKHHRQVHLNIKSKRYPLCTKKRAPLASDAAAPAHYTLPDSMFAV